MGKVDMEVNAILEVTCGGEGTEATGDGVEVVKGDFFD